MTHQAMLEALAPCGLSCEKCFAFAGGDIRRLSPRRKERLGNSDPFAERLETLLGDPVFASYSGFREILEHFASENRQGCRQEDCNLSRGAGCGSAIRRKVPASASNAANSRATGGVSMRTWRGDGSS